MSQTLSYYSNVVGGGEESRNSMSQTISVYSEVVRERGERGEGGEGGVVRGGGEEQQVRREGGRVERGGEGGDCSNTRYNCYAIVTLFCCS